MKGVLLFAFAGGLDYAKLAIICAKRIKLYCNLPISVITDNKQYFLENYPNDIFLFDNIIEFTTTQEQVKTFYNGIENSSILSWRNFNRVFSYDLTPYDYTLVIDTDYLWNSNFLERCFSLNSDFLIYKDSYDLATWRHEDDFQYVSNLSIPFYWATVFFFKKTTTNRLFFDLLKHIQEHWDYYRLLYQIQEPTFRNDYAFSIGLHIMSGYYPKEFKNTIPGKMFFIKDTDIFLKSEKNSFLFLIQKENYSNEYQPVKIKNLDVHIMNKFSILENYI